ncbi:MAG: C39 family peptidase [Candidatus Aquicultor sp.]
MIRKKIFAVCISVLLLISSSSAIALAKPMDSGSAGLVSGVMDNDPSLTPEVIRQLKQETEAKERSIGEPMTPSGCTCESNHHKVGASCLIANNEYGNISISVTNYMQEKSYWCGPASARQSLSFHKTKSGSSTTLPSQTTLATKIGTTTSGSTTTGIKNALNSYNGTFGSIYYVASNLTDQSDPLGTFKYRIGHMIDIKYRYPELF